MIHAVLAATFLAAAVPDGAAVSYRVDLTQARTQTVRIAMIIPTDGVDRVEVAMPVWRPGRYAIIDAAGTVRSLTAAAADGSALEVHKTRKSHWIIQTGGAPSVTVEYDLYANSLSDRTRHADATHAFLSGSSVFLYAPALRDAPCNVIIDAPEYWAVATGLEHAPGDPRHLVAPNYDVLVDSPIEVGELRLHDFTAADAPHQLAIWTGGGPLPDGFDPDAITRDLAKVIQTQMGIFGSLPYERYVFLVHAVTDAGGGTEHLNSTIMQTNPANLDPGNKAAYGRFLGLASHEFFHTWNVKAFRPAGLVPYDYDRENYTTLLWVAEGTTSYYDDLTLVRAGLDDADGYLRSLGGAIGAQRSNPGDLVQPLADSSFDAWIKFTRPTPDSGNYTVNFYSKGALVSFGLDMAIRRSSGDARSLDDVMRALYERFPAAKRGYSEPDLRSIINEMAGDTLDGLFERMVHGTGPLDLAVLVGVVGLELVFTPAKGESVWTDAEAPAKPFLGVRRSGASVSSVDATGPAYRAGVIAGDTIISVDGGEPARLDEIVSAKQPGDAVSLVISRRGVEYPFSITLDGRPDGRWTLRRIENPTDEQRAAYESWLGTPWPTAAQREAPRAPRRRAR